jgi:hypothetical protein
MLVFVQVSSMKTRARSVTAYVRAILFTRDEGLF